MRQEASTKVNFCIGNVRLATRSSLPAQWVNAVANITLATSGIAERQAKLGQPARTYRMGTAWCFFGRIAESGRRIMCARGLERCIIEAVCKTRSGEKRWRKALHTETFRGYRRQMQFALMGKPQGGETGHAPRPQQRVRHSNPPAAGNQPQQAPSRATPGFDSFDDDIPFWTLGTGHSSPAMFEDVHPPAGRVLFAFFLE